MNDLLCSSILIYYPFCKEKLNSKELTLNKGYDIIKKKYGDIILKEEKQ